MRSVLTLIILSLTLSLNAQLEISGTVKNASDSIFYISQEGGDDNITLSWLDTRVRISIDKDLHFKATIPETAIGSWYIKTPKTSQFFHLIKGENLQLIIDFSSKDPIQAFGKNADDFNYSSVSKEYRNQFAPDKKFSERSWNSNTDSALNYRKDFAAFQKQKLDKYRSEYRMSDEYYKWLSSQYKYGPFDRFLMENVANKDSVDEYTAAKILAIDLNDEYAALYNTEYNDLIEFYVSTRGKNKWSGQSTVADRFNFIASNDILRGSVKDVYLSRCMAKLFKAPDSIYVPLYGKYDKLVHNESMKQEVSEKRNLYINGAAAPILIDNIRAASINEVIKKYRGKVIYVDFWASWCVPCRSEMPNSAELSQKLKNENVVFLYFAYKDTENNWLKAREEIGVEGEHYLLDERMIREVEETFGINGIPHYAIIDKEGRIVSKNADRPTEVYQELVKLVKK